MSLRLAVACVELRWNASHLPIHAGTFFRATRMMFQVSVRRSVHAKRQYKLLTVLGAVGMVLSLARSSSMSVLSLTLDAARRSGNPGKCRRWWSRREFSGLG